MAAAPKIAAGLTKAAVVVVLLLMLTTPECWAGRMLLEQHAEPLLPASQTESYTCIGAGVMQHPCIVNPAYTFAVGFNTESSNAADRAYQAIAAQHVVCRQYATQADCQGTPASAELYCNWDAMNSRCVTDPYASLVMPLTCRGSKARSFLTCGRKGVVNSCRTDPECVLGKQARCFPAWLVSEARASNVTEQAVAEATALSILKGEESIIGSCAESALLQRAFQSCPYSAAWEKCDTSMCEFSTPTFIPSRVQPLGLGNTTATVPTVYEAAAQPNNTNSTELPFFDTYPGPVCFPDVARTTMVLHRLLGVSEGMARELNKLQAMCAETEDVTYHVAQGIASCGIEMFSYNSGSVYRTVGVSGPTAAELTTPPQRHKRAAVDPDRAPAASAAGQPGTDQISSSQPRQNVPTATEVGWSRQGV